MQAYKKKIYILKWLWYWGKLTSGCKNNRHC